MCLSPLQYDQTSGYEGHRAFAVQQLQEYQNIWDNEKLLRDPSTFYHCFFEDNHEKKRTTRAAHRVYEKGNYKVTRSSGTARVTYETDAKNRIQQQLRDALDHIFSLFEMMYAYGDHHLVHTISEECSLLSETLSTSLSVPDAVLVIGELLMTRLLAIDMMYL